MEGNEAANLLSQLPAIEVIVCPMCGGDGRVERALNVTCPRCHGCGKSTNSGEPLERWDTHDGHRR